MLIHASGQIYPNFFLLTFGGSCHYIIQKEDGCVIFDPGLSFHVPYLYKRLEKELKDVPITDVFLTHLHPERVAALPYLRKDKNIVAHGSALMQEKLQDESFVRALYDEELELCKLYNPEHQQMDFAEFSAGLKIDEVFTDTETISISDDLKLRCIKSAGHTEESFSFVLEPYDFLIVDEGFGYFRGRELAAPGGDWNLKASVESIERFKDLELSAICFPNLGLLTGQLVRNHLQNIIVNYADLEKECARTDITNEDKISSLKKSFYSCLSRDPLVHKTMERTFKAILKQLALE